MITATEVHRTIQNMNRDLSVNDSPITIGAIANTLQIATDELLVHLDMLRSLYYIRFADTKKEKVRLTFNGQHTIVPVYC